MNHMRLILLFGCFWMLALQGVFGQSSLYLKAPFDAAVFSTEQDSIKFTWNQISGASSYTVQLSNDPGFGTFTAFASTTGTRWIQQADLTGTGYWRVVSSNAVFSAVRSFSLIDLTALGSLIYHIHAEAGLNIISNKVANWDNQANANYNASQGVSTARPTWKNNEINGLSTVHFGGSVGTSQHSLSLTPLEIEQANFSVFVSYKQQSVNTGLPYVLGYQGGGRVGGLHVRGTSGSYNNFGLVYTNPLFERRPNFAGDLKWATRSFVNNLIYFNGVEVSGYTGTGVDGFRFNTIGTRPDLTSLNFHGDLAEVIVFNDGLSAANRSTVENYLLTKYTPYPDLGEDKDVCANSVFLGPIFDPAFNTIQWSTGQTGDQTIQVTQNGWYWVETEAFGRVMRDSIFVSGLVPQPQLTVSNNTTICYGDTVALGYTNLLEPGINVEWLDGSTGPSINVGSAGTYGVTFTNAEGCSFSSIPVTFAVNEFPLTNGLGADRTVCLNTELFFEYGTAGLAPYTHLWSDGSTDASLTPQTIGNATYNIAVTDALGCVALDTVEIELVATEGPLLNFDFDTVCFNTLNMFTDLSTAATGDNITTATWIFPNDTLTGASVNYQAPLNIPYFVDLVVSTAAGCEGRMRDTVTFLPQPDAYFVPGNFCQEVSGSFLASQLSPESIVSWQWNFGDPASGVNNTATGAAVSHIFNLAGNYNVQLIATDVNGCTDTVVQVVNVKAAPSVDFNFIEACAGSFISFNNSTTIVSPFVIASYSWQFGDGSTSGQTNPLKPYLNAGNYNVTLTANGNNGCSSATTKTVKVHAFPQPNYLADVDCAGSPIFVEDNSFVQNGSVATVTWSFNGSAPVSGFEASYTFETIGNQTIEQTVMSAFGCETTVEHTITLTDYLFADFTAIPGAILGGYPMTFQNNSVGQDTTIWIVNGTDTVSTTNLTWTFPTSAIGSTVTITFIVTNDSGCSDTIVRTYPVLENRTDLAINQLFAQEVNGFYTIGAELENRGSTPITGADLFLRSANTPVIKEAWSGLLEAGDKEIYIFSTQLPATVSAEVLLENYICAEAQLTAPLGFEDEDLTNNERCYTKEGNESILLIPYPNPTSGLFNLRVILPEAAEATIQIYDNLGKLVSTIAKNAALSKGLTTYTVDATSWANGTYSIVLLSGKDRKSGKIQVLHRD
jgi:PKD repeat protein